MTPEQALDMLHSASTMAHMTKQDHMNCQEAKGVLGDALQRMAATQSKADSASTTRKVTTRGRKKVS